MCKRGLRDLPLTSTALLSPRESAVLSFIFSTSRCFTFFMAEGRETYMYIYVHVHVMYVHIHMYVVLYDQVCLSGESECNGFILAQVVDWGVHSPMSMFFPGGGSILLKVMVMGPWKSTTKHEVNKHMYNNHFLNI